MEDTWITLSLVVVYWLFAFWLLVWRFREQGERDARLGVISFNWTHSCCLFLWCYWVLAYYGTPLPDNMFAWQVCEKGEEEGEFSGSCSRQNALAHTRVLAGWFSAVYYVVDVYNDTSPVFVVHHLLSALSALTIVWFSDTAYGWAWLLGAAELGGLCYHAVLLLPSEVTAQVMLVPYTLTRLVALPWVSVWAVRDVWSLWSIDTDRPDWTGEDELSCDPSWEPCGPLWPNVWAACGAVMITVLNACWCLGWWYFVLTGQTRRLLDEHFCPMDAPEPPHRKRAREEADELWLGADENARSAKLIKRE